MQHADDPIRIPVIGFVAGAFIAIAFATGALDALLSSHFTSWDRLSAEPTDSTAKTIKGLMPAARVLTMIGAAVFAYTSLRRVSFEGYKLGVIRLALVAFSPIIVELTAMGSQDGQVPDLNKLPIHSMILLVLITLGPVLVAAWDVKNIRRGIAASLAV